MKSVKQPCKHSVRAWMQQRQRQPAPLPDIAEIRRAVGWDPARAVRPLNSPTSRHEAP